MSTVMGLVDKNPIKLIILLGNQSICKSNEYVMKLRKTVEFVGKKVAELFLSLREEYEFRGFQITHHHCYITSFRSKLKEIRRNKNDIVLGFFVGDFPHFTSCNNGFDIYCLIPDRIMNILPQHFCEEEKWNEVTKEKLGELLSHLVHEIFHSLGAFHSDIGIMSGYQNLLSDGKQLKDVKLLNHTDQKTLTIICESMSIITTLPPQRDLKYDAKEKVLTYESDQSIAVVFFVLNDKYTNVYKEFVYLDACKKYTEVVPTEWDGFVVVHFCGHIFCYSKNDVRTTKRCTKSIVF